MQLKITTDYAIRTVLYLAITNKITPSTEISEKMCIPHKYLVNFIVTLRKNGIVKTHSGANGGYSLNRDPKEINLFELIEAMEGTTKINRCLEDDEYCSRFATLNCPVRDTYVTLQDSFESYLKSITIQSLKEKLNK